MEVFSELFNNPIVLFFAIAVGFFAWQTRQQAKINETLFNEFHTQYTQFQNELPKMRKVLELLQKQLEHNEGEHHGLIIERDAKIEELVQDLKGLRKDLDETRSALAQAESKLKVSEVTRKMFSKYLKVENPKLYDELTAAIDGN